MNKIKLFVNVLQWTVIASIEFEGFKVKIYYNLNDETFGDIVAEREEGKDYPAIVYSNGNTITFIASCNEEDPLPMALHCEGSEDVAFWHFICLENISAYRRELQNAIMEHLEEAIDIQLTNEFSWDLIPVE